MTRLSGAVVAALLLLVWASTTPTLSAWTTARVDNPTNGAATASLDFTHAAGPCSASLTTTASVACAGTVAPSAAATAGGVTGTDRITNNGTAPAASLNRTVSAASCATVKLDNRTTPANVMLPRYNTRFRQTGPVPGSSAVTLDGSAYAAAVSTHQVAITNGVTYGVGIWFRATAGQSGPLFSLAGSPANTPGGDDRALALNANGTLSFAFNTLGAKVTSTTSYADGAWHFAYVTLTGTFLGLANTTTINVDGAVAATTSGLLSYTNVTGYWHAGWANPALTGTAAYFSGSLSNMVVFNNAAPAAPTAAQRASQAAFTTWAATANDHWLLADTGTTTYTGSQPAIGTTAPCSMLTIAWSFTNPAATVPGPASLAAFADGTARPVSASPGPGTTQVGTVTIARAGGYNAYVSGLRLYVPFSDVVRAGPGSWTLTFQWQSADAVVIA